MSVVEQPLVSIGIPCYNEEKYIIDTIESALNQTYSNTEVIIFDNCSTDNTENIIKSHKSINKLTYNRHKKNIGALENFKVALQKAKGKYFMWLGGHDMISKMYVKEAVELLENNPNLSHVYFDHQFIDENGHEMETPILSDIECVGLEQEERLIKVATNLQACTSVHGIFRQNFKHQIPFVNCIGPDHLVLYALANLGEIKFVNKVAYYRREARKFETDEQKLERYTSFGMDVRNDYKELIFEHFRYSYEKVYGMNNIARINFFCRLFKALGFMAVFSWDDLIRIANFKYNDKRFKFVLATCKFAMRFKNKVRNITSFK